MKDNPVLTNSRPEFRQLPNKLNEHLLNLGAPHVDSFNEMLDHGFDNMVRYLKPVYLETPAGEKVTLRISEIKLAKPRVPKDFIHTKDFRMYPAEARLSNSTYGGTLSVHLNYSIDGDKNEDVEFELGQVPVMLKSKACNLWNLTPEEMVQKGEHDSDWGGIFIIKGNEKIVRMLLMSRRNFPIAVQRSTWKTRGLQFSEYGILVRSVREDEVGYNNVLHFLNNGSAKLMFSQNKTMSYVPICMILKCLVNYSDVEIYRRLMSGYEHDLYYAWCVENMLRQEHHEGRHTQLDAKQYLGKVFRPRFPEVPPWVDDTKVVDFILNERILIHLETMAEKFDMLVFMVQKLYQVAQGHNKVENVDSIMMQEVLLPGKAIVLNIPTQKKRQFL